LHSEYYQLQKITRMEAGKYINPFTEEEERLMIMRDLKNVVDTAEEKGINKGIEIGKKEGIDIGKKESTIEIAKKMKTKGFDINSIINLTGLSKEDIEQL